MLSRYPLLAVVTFVTLLSSASWAFITNPYDEIYISTIPLNSKEYKVSLKPSLFKNGLKSIDEYREVIEGILSPGQLVKSYIGKKRDEKKTRLVSFYDTAGSCILKNNGFSLRDRNAVEVGERWASIKYRSKDIEESGDRSVDDAQKKGIQKFEEDLVGVDSIYSHSNKLKVAKDISLEHEALKIFPSLRRSGLSPSHRLVKVGNYTAHEFNYVLGEIRVDTRYKKGVKKTKKFKKLSLRKLELTLWFLPNKSDPIIAEITWKIKDESGQYNKETLRSANNLFNKLKAMKKWVDPNPEPKTLMIYAHSAGFCSSAAMRASKTDITILSYLEKLKINKLGHAHVSVEVLLKGASNEEILLPLNFREAKNVKGTVPIWPVKINGTWYFSIQVKGKNRFTYEYDVFRYLDWRVGLDLDGFPNPTVGQFENVRVKYKFTNTSVHKINNYRLQVRVPDGYAISRVVGVAPKKLRKVDLDRFVLVKGGIDVGYAQNEAKDDTQAFSLSTGKYAGVTFYMKPAKRGYLIFIVGLLLCLGWLIFYRDILK
ncbi:MAG: hypothetical protein ISR65_05500 [Bacteriovoracaceae bacterium]|nr:hypothetical protein [Bacteriovoracaceae bacterium]